MVFFITLVPVFIDMKKLLFSLLLSPLISIAQVQDDFTDADFNHNPPWKGDTLQFQISNYSSTSWSVHPRLQLDGVVADTAFLCTSSIMGNLNNKEWDFWVRLAFNTSKSNNCRVYLVANSSNLEGSLNGYFVMFGDDVSDQWDSISLYRQNGASVQKIIAGHHCFTGASSNYRVKVERDNLGNWELFTDITGGNNFISEGTGFDNSINSSSYFGVFCKYTTTNKTNFYFDDIYAGPLIVDTIAPEVVSVHAISTTQIEVMFSENVDQGSAENETNFQITGLGNAAVATKDATNPALVHLTYSQTFAEGTTYSLNISGVKDIPGNTMVPINKPFTYYNAVSFDVVINEIMADPDPPVGLPNFEYLELKNRTPFELSLKDWTLKIGATVLTFPEISIFPHGYLIVTDEIAVSSFSIYGPTIGFSSFVLTNTGTSIFLKNQNNLQIHYIKYSDSWYRDNAKDDGGWSIEQIDPGNPCGEAGNWKASMDNLGGTPATQNSVFTQNPDTIPPQINNIRVIASNQVEILLNEPLVNQQNIEAADFHIDNGIGSPVTVALIAPENKKIVMNLSNPIQQNVLYTLKYNDTVFDCVGNYLAAFSKTFVMYTPKSYDIVINEIMADPEPQMGLPNFEYLELYNRTAYPISLSGWKLSLSSYKKPFPDITIQPQGYLIVSATGSSSALNQYGLVAEISGFSLSNTGEVVELLDTLQHVISFVNYNDNWYMNSSKDEGGWALERIDSGNPCGELSNWKVSNDPNGGTPGKVNSVAGVNPDQSQPILIRASVDRNNLHQIMIYFDETLDSTQMKSEAKYTVDNGIGNPYLVKLSWPDNKIVSLEFSQPLQQNIIYTVNVSDSIFDCSGNKIPANSKARFAIPVLPDSADIVINEILSNPKDDGVDFVEIYNRSAKVLDCKDLILSSPENNYVISSGNFLSFPGDYILLSTNAAMVQNQYFTPHPFAFISLPSFPPLSNDQGAVFLQTNSGFLIDAMQYTADMHFPLLNTTEGVSLERIDFNRPASDITNWHSASQSVGFATPAYQNSQFLQGEATDAAISISPPIFSPDNDGYNDVLLIQCKTEGPGSLINITIFDAKGRLIKYLIKSRYISGDETFSWDGTTDRGQKANTGIYIVYAERFDAAGKVKHYRLTAVLAAKL